MNSLANHEPEPEVQTNKMSQDLTKILKANAKYASSVNEFGFKLLKKLYLQNTATNVFISPPSILFGLSMVNDGAVGGTERAIRSTMQLEEFTCDEINEMNSELIGLFSRTVESTELQIANAIVLDRQCKFRPKFTSDCDTFYSAKVFEKDFRDKATIEEINGWVKENTNGKIQTIIDRFAPLDILVILNAIYFSAKWNSPFKPEATLKKPFYSLDGCERTGQQMLRYGEFRYYEEDGFQSIRLPYERRFSMNIILPRKRDGLSKLIKRLDKSKWNELNTSMDQRPGAIGLPRFKIEYSKSLVDVLGDLGMSLAFSAKADFSRMTDLPAFVSDVIHKTYLEVNERGTEAAAVTAFGLIGASLKKVKLPKPFSMIVDHPFFCVITENVSGLILFAGAIVDPSTE